MSFFRNTVIFLLAVSCCVSCAQLDPGGWLFKRIDPEIALYNDARQKHQENDFQAAYALYREHAGRYPQSRHAPEVLFSLGQVCVSLKRYGEAVQFFQEVIARYPDTDAARQARVEIMGAVFLAGDYRQVLRYGDEALRMDLSEQRMMRVHQMVGDAHLALGNGAAAIMAFLQAYEAAGKEDIDLLAGRVRSAAEIVSTTELHSILERLKGRPPAGEIMYLLGIRYFEAGEYHEAKLLLDQFIEGYPRHPYADFAKKLVADIPVTDLFDKDVVGCLLPLSGRYENFGHQALKGIELALAVFSGSGSRDASHLKMVIRDTASDAAGAVSGVRELNDRRVAVIIGPMIEADAAAAEAQKLKVPIVTLTQKADIPAIGEWVFRNFLTPAMQVKAVVGHAVNDMNLSRFAILYPEENYGEMFMNLFWDEVIASGGRVVGVESYRPDQTDFSVPIRKLTGMYYEVPESLVEEASVPPVVLIGEKSSSPQPAERIMPGPVDADAGDSRERWFDNVVDTAMAKEHGIDDEAVPEENEKPGPIIDFDAVFIPDSPAKAGLIMPYLAYQDVTGVSLLGTNLWHSDRLIQMAGAHGRGAVFPDGFFAQSASEQVKRFVDLFEKTYGYTPGFIEAVSYDTAMMVFDVVCRTDVRQRSRFRKMLVDMAEYQGVTGNTRFSESGEAVKDVYLIRITGGRFREVPQRRPFRPDESIMSW